MLARVVSVSQVNGPTKMRFVRDAAQIETRSSHDALHSKRLRKVNSNARTVALGVKVPALIFTDIIT